MLRLAVDWRSSLVHQVDRLVAARAEVEVGLLGEQVLVGVHDVRADGAVRGQLQRDRAGLVVHTFN